MCHLVRPSIDDSELQISALAFVGRASLACKCHLYLYTLETCNSPRHFTITLTLREGKKKKKSEKGKEREGKGRKTRGEREETREEKKKDGKKKREKKGRGKKEENGENEKREEEKEKK
jgi:hypothetical protein